MRFSGIYFDGRQAVAHPVDLVINEGWLQLRGDGVERCDALDDLIIPAPLARSARLILFADGARCEIADADGFAQALPGRGDHWIGRLERNGLQVAIGALMLVLLAVSAYLWGLPYAAERVALGLPAKLLLEIDQRVFNELDGRLFQPSQLSESRQKAIRQIVEHLAIEGAPGAHSLVFRRSDALGANAFALPGGTILLLDDLAALTDDNMLVAAVLAHELGHVRERHAARQMIQSSVVGLVLTWYLGDISSLAVVAPTVLLETHYSRAFERDADRFAADLLRQKGYSPGLLADMLQLLDDYWRDPAKASLNRGEEPYLDYFSTHPNTAERMRWLRAQ